MVQVEEWIAGWSNYVEGRKEEGADFFALVVYVVRK